MGPGHPSNFTDDGRSKKDDGTAKQGCAALPQGYAVCHGAEAQYKEASQALLTSTLDELNQLATETEQPAYRAKQLRGGLLRGARNLEDISDLPKAWREELARRGLVTGRSQLHHHVEAPDGTRKFLLQLQVPDPDGLVVETVGIPASHGSRDRLTVCVSSQVGCPMRCTFCATGKGGFARNLKAHEIVDQVLTVQEAFGTRVSNVVFMGMGEPLLNWRVVLQALEFLNKDIGIGARHMTVSTVGIPNAIAKLAAHGLQATLAVSIHAPNQELRERLVPSAKLYPLEALMQDSREYFKVTGRRVTFEYTLMADVNDSPQLATKLAKLLIRHDLCSHVNLIPWNPILDSSFERPSNNRVRAFMNELEKHHIPVSIRHSRGLEAAAACGQLRNIHQKIPVAM
eukprot:jgi/Astpho2/9940/Aster-06646